MAALSSVSEVLLRPLGRRYSFEVRLKLRRTFLEVGSIVIVQAFTTAESADIVEFLLQILESSNP
jgi:hypothetical protein